MIIAVNANFQLKQCAVSNESHDSALGFSWDYFVEDEGYREHLKNYVDQEEVSDGLDDWSH